MEQEPGYAPIEPVVGKTLQHPHGMISGDSCENRLSLLLDEFACRKERYWESESPGCQCTTERAASLDPGLVHFKCDCVVCGCVSVNDESKFYGEIEEAEALGRRGHGR